MVKIKPQQKNWQENKLEDLLDLVIDYRGKTPKKLGSDWSDNGIPALSAKNIKDGSIVNRSAIKYVDKELYKKWMKEELEKLDILLTSEAPLGETYLLTEEDKYCLSQRLFALRADKKRINPYFLYYYLKSSRGQEELTKRATGSTVSGIRQSALADVKVFYPQSIANQERIGKTLFQYDVLIENNTRRIQILEEMAQTIYKEWFVYFRFPGYEKVKMVDSKTEFGKIPEGWEVKTLGQAAENFDSKRKPISKMKRAEIQGVYPYYGAAKVIDYVNDYIFDGKYLLMAEDGSVITKSGNPVLQFVNEKFWPNNHTHILRGVDVSTEYLYTYLSQFSIAGHITGVAQPKINQKNLNRIPIMVPNKIVMESFDALVCPTLQHKWNLESQNQILRKARDLLLPKLVTGEIEVKESKPLKTKKEKEQSKKPIVSPFQDAVILANIVHQVSDNGFQPTRLRCAKLHYFVDRLSGVNPTEKYAVKEMGPYDVSSRYKGGERVAKNKKYIGQDKNKITIASNIQEALGYSYRQLQNIPNVLSTLKYKKDEQLEILATVDYAVYDLVNKGHKKVTPKEILDYISNNEVWKQKIERLKLTEDKIKDALAILKTLSQQGLNYSKS